ncbi:MAG: hypothetical protein RL514_59 [Verrucomicrobiota bacterium]|jgi:predicted nucleotide-binding protein
MATTEHESGEKNEFELLLNRAHNFIQYPQKSRGVSVQRWMSKGTKWLRKNLQESGLANEFLTIGAVHRDSTSLRTSDVAKVQRGLKVLLKAQELLPFLKEDAHPSVPRPENSKRVFIVHGHNDSLKLAAARLVEKLGLVPVILHEQPNKGRTIIEKFLDHSDVAFALVLLTDDDKGGPKASPLDSYQFRARQNVILELGFFIGRLDRQRVAAIYQAGVEVPSDYSGVVFIPFDGEGGVWQIHAAKEMRAAGLKVDLNRI